MSLFFARRGEERSHWFGTDSAPYGGRTVTADNAPSLGPMFAALRHIVDFGSTLPLDSYRKDGALRTEIAIPQLFARLDAPGGPGLVSWLGQAFYGLALGNAVGWITETDGFGFPVGVEWLHWSQWSYDEQMRQWYAFGSPVPSSQLVHIPWIVPPGRRLGLSPIDCYAATLAAGMSAQDYADIKRGGGMPPYHIKNTQKTVPPEVIAAMRSRSAAAFAKGDGFVTGNDWDFTAISIPPNHAQFIATLNLTAKQVAAAYGLDPREVGGETGDSLTYSTDESRSLNRAANMRPYLERVERAFARLLPAKQYVRLNVDATIRTDIKTRTEVVGAQIQDGRMSLNEARALEDRSPIDGGDSFAVGQDKKQRDVAETLQKIYLAVGSVITSDEARDLANQAGADLPTPGPVFPAKAPAPSARDKNVPAPNADPTNRGDSL